MTQPIETEAHGWRAPGGAAPDLPRPATKEAWISQRQKGRADCGHLVGKLPPRPAKPVVQTLSREERDDYVLEKFQFDNGAGAVVPGYLLLPKRAAGKSPGILYCHWHGGEYDVGKEELFRTNAVPEPAGPALARRGCLVLGIHAYGFGERNGKGPGGPAEKDSASEMTASKFNLWLGRTLWGMILRDDLMALDYLSSRPEVDARRLAVTGISMGATRTWWILALDDRPRTGVAVCCLTRYQNLIADQGLKYHGIYYFVPGMLNHFDTEAVVALAAPRPLLFQSGELDGGSPVEGIGLIEAKVRAVYRLFGAEGQFQNVIYPAADHHYLPQLCEKTLAWLDRNLKDK